MLSDLIHREEAPRHDAAELSEHLQACEVAKAAGASIPADIDPETYREMRPVVFPEERRTRQRRRRVPPPYTLSGQ